MTKYTWDTDCTAESNVSVNDGVVTYFAEWDTDKNGAIDLRQVFNAFAATYDHNGERGVVEVEVENLITGETLTDEIECDLDEYDEDDEDEDGDEDAEDDDAIAALWHGEIDFLDRYQPPGRRGR